MSDLVRFGVSIQRDLLEAFDAFLAEKSYSNRSEAVRDLIRRGLAERDWEKGGEVAGGIVLVYDHHRRELSERLTHIQHHALDVIVSNMHVHLDHQNCLEVIVVRGPVEQIRDLASRLQSLKGVAHCSVAEVAAS